MKVSTKTRYALRLMLQLALDYGKNVSMLGDIAKREGLSEKYLSLIVIPLRANKLINSVRGAKGVYFLTKPPSEITVKDIFESTDGAICTVDCNKSGKKCEKVGNCITKEVWIKLDETIKNTMENISLQDLVDLYNKKNKTQINYEI